MKNIHIITLLSLILLSSQTLSIIDNVRLLKVQFGDSSSKDKACSKKPENYEGNKQYDTLEAFVKSLNMTDSAGEKFLLDLILYGKVDNLKDFLIEIWIYILMLVLAFIALISKNNLLIGFIIAWPFMCLCCMCSCGIFNDEKTKGSCGFINMIITLVFLGLIILTSITGLSQSKYINIIYSFINRAFVTYFNGSLCSLYTFLDNTVTGEKSEEVPRWGGAKGIKESFQSASKSLKELKNQVISLPSEPTKTNADNYQGKINNFKNMDYEIAGPAGDTITPIYGTQFTDTTDKNSYINQITNEKVIIIDITLKALGDLNAIIIKVQQNKQMENRIGGIGILLGTFQTLVESISNLVADNVGKIQTAFSEVVLLIFQIIYGIFIIVSVATMTLLMLYIWCEWHFLKLFMHVFWNLIFFFTVLSFIIGFFFGILGVIGHQTIPVINHVFSVDFLNSPESPFYNENSTIAATLLNTCINGNGDIAQALEMDKKEDPSQELDTLIRLSINIENITTSLEKVSESTVLPNIESKMKAFKTNISSTSPEYEESLTKINNDLKTCGKEERYYVSGQTHQIKDIEITADSPNVYPDCQPGTETNTMEQRIKYVQISIKENSDKMNAIPDITTMINDYKLLMTNLQTDLKTADKATGDFTNAFANIIGGNSLFSMFNCKFVRFDMINFIDQFGNRFSIASRTIGICCLICSFGSFINVFFLMSTIYYYSETARDNLHMEKAQTKLINDSTENPDNDIIPKKEIEIAHENY